MEKHIMGENGISYTLGEDGLYYPDLYLPEDATEKLFLYTLYSRLKQIKTLYIVLLYAK